jgi:hypothetical protein
VVLPPPAASPPGCFPRHAFRPPPWPRLGPRGWGSTYSRPVALLLFGPAVPPIRRPAVPPVAPRGPAPVRVPAPTGFGGLAPYAGSFATVLAAFSAGAPCGAVCLGDALSGHLRSLICSLGPDGATGTSGSPHTLSCLVTWCCHLVLLEFLCLLPLCSPGHWYYSMRLVLMGLVLGFVCDCLHGGSHSRCPCYWHCWLLNGAFCLQPLFKATGLARLTGSTASVSAAFSAWC